MLGHTSRYFASLAHDQDILVKAATCASGSQFCKHAVGTLEDVILQAIAQGFVVYGLTEHVPRYRADDLYPEESDLTLDALAGQFEAFLTEAHRLKAKYADKINLLVGLETESITELDLSGLASLLAQHTDQIEYIVGSVHHVAGIPIDFDQPTFASALTSFAPDPSSPAEPATTSAFLCAYLDAQHDLLRRFHPEVVGHLDLCRLYTPVLRFADFPAALERVRRNVAFAVSYGALFELNAAAFRKGWDAAYPAPDVVEIVLGAGGRFTLSDDSHGPHAVGLNYHKLLEYARREGIGELWTLEACGERNAGGRLTVPRRVEGDWWEHSFWQQFEAKT